MSRRDFWWSRGTTLQLPKSPLTWAAACPFPLTISCKYFWVKAAVTSGGTPGILAPLAITSRTKSGVIFAASNCVARLLSTGAANRLGNKGAGAAEPSLFRKEMACKACRPEMMDGRLRNRSLRVGGVHDFGRGGDDLLGRDLSDGCRGGGRFIRIDFNNVQFWIVREQIMFHFSARQLIAADVQTFQQSQIGYVRNRSQFIGRQIQVSKTLPGNSTKFALSPILNDRMAGEQSKSKKPSKNEHFRVQIGRKFSGHVCEATIVVDQSG
uniref:Uncharacterized protein n=1 Tax=Romanomermis culicivorax TaxID=13658 RepID=A0A915IEH5_ROMCU